MAIHYKCSRCASKLGVIENADLEEQKLGLHALTDQEKQDMVSYESNGDIHIKVICEVCHEALTRNPDLHQYDYLIQ